MPTCDVCGGGEDVLIIQCNYCDLRLCPDHRLPEKHDCLGQDIQRRDTHPSRYTPEHTVGSAPDEDLASSPDVAPDGSIRRDESDGNADKGWLARLRAVLEKLFWLA